MPSAKEIAAAVMATPQGEELAAIVDDSDLDRTHANGGLYGLSAGLRLRDVRFGFRWRVYDTTEFTLWTLALSAGFCSHSHFGAAFRRVFKTTPSRVRARLAR